MSARRVRWSVGLAVAAGLCLGAGPAGADWLVLRDGTRVETRGPWRVDGRLVVFTGADGTLSSLRDGDVDVAASRQATQAAAAPRPAPGPAPAPASRQAVRRFTNADIPPGRPEPPASPEAGEEAPPAEGEGEAATERSSAAELIVVASEQGEDAIDGHLVVTGTLANAARDTATAVRIAVRVHGPEGEVIGNRPAIVDRPALPPGAETGFRAEFPGVFAAFAVTFEPHAVMVLGGGAAEAAAEGPEAAEAPPEP